MATGRNEPCPCGSGKKFKHCCEGKQNSSSSRLILALIAVVVLVAIIAMVSNSGQTTSAGRVWSPEHGHYHDASGREVPR